MSAQNARRRLPRGSAVLPLAFLAAACSGGSSSGSGGGGGGGGSAPATHDESLEALGVDLTKTPRVDEYGQPLPESYTPLGSVVRIDPLVELWVAGLALQQDPTAVATLLEDVAGATFGPGQVVAPEALFALTDSAAPWIDEAPPAGFPESLRASAAADLDGDGTDEIATFFLEDAILKVQVVERLEVGFDVREQSLIFNVPDVLDVAIAAGDFDGDMACDLALGYAFAGQASLVFVGLNELGELEIHPASSKVLLANFFDSSMTLVLEAGNLDHDGPAELVALVNERAGTPTNTQITSRYHVFDDAASGYGELEWGFVEGFESGTGLHVAGLADVALGDVDGDHRDEILLGGLASLESNCNATSYVLIAIDDAPANFAPLGASLEDAFYSGCDQADPYELRFVHVNALDLDGDDVDEVQVDRYVFDDWIAAEPWTPVPAWGLPQNAFLDDDQLEGLLDESNTAVTSGDFTGDARDDVLIWRAGSAGIGVYGLDETGAQVTLLARIPTVPGALGVNPLLVPVNVDQDTPLLRATGEREFVFIEPIVLAVLAAPPYIDGIGQVTEVCQTTFGNTQSSGLESETSVSVSASASVGFEVDGGALTQSEFQLKGTVSRKVSLITSLAYDVSKTVSFVTGPGEDTVVFTTVPLDRFTYEVLGHPLPEMVGKILDVALPREPIYLQVERSFYNAHVAEGGLKIDQKIFGHTAGDAWSYPTRSEKDDLLNKYGGLQIGAQSVGQGAGATELELEVSEEYGLGGALELGFEFEVEATGATILAGFSVGASIESQLSITSGASTTYSGTVGSIAGESFLDNQYSFGLFTYVQLDPATGQEFEVINYWVE